MFADLENFLVLKMGWFFLGNMIMILFPGHGVNKIGAPSGAQAATDDFNWMSPIYN